MKRVYNKLFILLLICLTVSLFGGCVDFEQMAADKLVGVEEQGAEEEAEIKYISLGDINRDGKEESILLETLANEQETLKLYNGKKLVDRFELEEGYNYLSFIAYVINIDNDATDEIIVLIKTSTRNVFSVKIINFLENGTCELFDFPTDVVSNESNSGFNATVTAKENFVYQIAKGEFLVEIDASRLYSLSLRYGEEYDKMAQIWERILESDFHGESLGVADICVIKNEKNEPVVEVYESIVGGDDKVMGYLITEIKYDSNGKYTIERISFKERVDVMP